MWNYFFKEEQRCIISHSTSKSKLGRTCRNCPIASQRLWKSFSNSNPIKKLEFILQFLFNSTKFWICQTCKSYRLCNDCHLQVKHPHTMIKSEIEAKMKYMQNIIHACKCKDGNCEMQNCVKMKRVVKHTKNCTKKNDGQCPICKQLIALCCFHAKICQDSYCQVQFCATIKQTVNKLFNPIIQYKSPPLILASSKGHLEVSQILLQNGAFVNFTETKYDNCSSLGFWKWPCWNC